MMPPRGEQPPPDYGVYLSPEPMLLRPEFAKSQARSGRAVQSYAYAGNNPVGNTDPDGRFIRVGECGSWAEAVRIAKERAGCTPAPSRECGQQDPEGKCRRKLDMCPNTRGCNLCSILSDGAGPLAIIQRGDHLPLGYPRIANARAFTQFSSSGSVSHVEVAYGRCEGSAESLAETLLHEAVHVCKDQTGFDTEDGFGLCDADAIVDRCQ